MKLYNIITPGFLFELYQSNLVKEMLKELRSHAYFDRLGEIFLNILTNEMSGGNVKMYDIFNAQKGDKHEKTEGRN